MSALGQIGRFPEVIRGEEGGGVLTGRRGEDGRVHVEEAVVVQPVADGPDDLGAHPQDGPLARGAQPQVAAIHQEFNAVLLGGDGILLGQLHDLDVPDG